MNPRHVNLINLEFEKFILSFPVRYDIIAMVGNSSGNKMGHKLNDKLVSKLYCRITDQIHYTYMYNYIKLHVFPSKIYPVRYEPPKYIRHFDVGEININPGVMAGYNIISEISEEIKKTDDTYPSLIKSYVDLLDI